MSTRLVVVHVLAALFWGFIGMVAGERSLSLTATFGLGSLLVASGVAMHVKAATRHHARRVLLIGDSVPLVLGTAVVVYLIQDALRTGTFGGLVMDAGAALALFVPAALAPWLVAYADGKS